MRQLAMPGFLALLILPVACDRLPALGGEGESCFGNGTCNDGLICNTQTGRCSSQCVVACSDRVCGDDGCGGTCAPGCGANETCDASGHCVCAPACSAKECGDDGCGGSCGACLVAGTICNETSGQCEVCTPDCMDKECGDDGCGGSCGTCLVADTICNEASGQCEACEHPCEAGFTRCQGADIETCLAEGGSCTRWDTTLNCLADGRTCFDVAGIARCGEGLLLVGLVAGAAHTCGLDARGQAWCWGRGEDGQLGVEPEAPSPVPVQVDTSQLSSIDDKGFRQLAAGWRHTCGLLAGGQVVCWGDNDSNQLGDPSAGVRRTRPTLPVRTAAETALPPIKQLAAGGDTTCGLSATGEAWCWGRNGEGQLGVGALGQSDCTARSGAERVDMASLGWADATLAKVEVGARHACALTASGRVACWGSHEFGQLGTTQSFTCGTDAATGSPAPIEVGGSLDGVKAVDLDAGEDHTCALDDQARVHCWGANAEGQCGFSPDTAIVYEPAIAIMSTPPPAALAAGLAHTCLLRAGGEALCWGGDGRDFGTGGLLEDLHEGFLGNGPGGSGHVPAGVLLSDDGRRWPLKALAAGLAHTCALDARGRVFCWGSDRHGQLGDGGATTEDAQSPVAVARPAEEAPVRALTALAPGGEHTCGLTAAGRALCWGVADSGQLGLGAERTGQLTPQAVLVADIPLEADRAFVALRAGGLFTCALSGSGRVRCFGANDKGQLGNGSGGGIQDHPQALLQGDGWLGLATGFDFACGFKQSGLGFGWGENGVGQIGLAPSTPVLAPIGLAAADVRWRGLSAGLAHACGVTSGGQILCWGNQEFGRLGNGSVAMGSALPTELVLGPQTPVGAWIQVAAGAQHACGLTAAGEVWCWGSDLRGQLGDDASQHDYPNPRPVDFAQVEPPEARAMVQIATSHTSSCSLNAQGQIFCWGQIHQEAEAVLPASVDLASLEAGDQAFTALRAGSRHVCGLTAGGRAYCWGVNDRGQGGTGDLQNRSSPFPVSLDSL